MLVTVSPARVFEWRGRIECTCHPLSIKKLTSSLCTTHSTVEHLWYGILTHSTHNKVDNKRNPMMVNRHLTNICWVDEKMVEEKEIKDESVVFQNQKYRSIFFLKEPRYRKDVCLCWEQWNRNTHTKTIHSWCFWCKWF